MCECANVQLANPENDHHIEDSWLKRNFHLRRADRCLQFTYENDNLHNKILQKCKDILQKEKMKFSQKFAKIGKYQFLSKPYF